MDRNEAINTTSGVLSTTGGALAAIPTPWTMAAGAVLELGSGFVQMFKKPEKVEVPAGERVAAFYQNNNVANLASMNGLSQQDVQNIAQIGESEKASLNSTFNSMPVMSLFDRQRMGEALMQTMGNIETEYNKKVSALDIGASIQRASALTSASAAAANIEADIARQERIERDNAQATRAARAKAMGDSIVNVTKALNMMLDMSGNKETPDATPSQQKTDWAGKLEKPTELIDTNKPLETPSFLSEGVQSPLQIPSLTDKELEKPQELYGDILPSWLM